MIDRTVSHYRIIEKLGEGGMGVVYVAEDTHLGRRVAIKFLSSLDHSYRARFLREARAVSALTHPNIATVFDYGETPEGQPYIVMELIKGETLSELLQEGPLAHKQAVRIVSSIAEALGEAHHQGIVHRDVKPSNIVITERGQVKVLDFGLVKQLHEQYTFGGDPNVSTLRPRLTRSDVVVGTPLYLSPEQATGKPVDGRSDLFALGALLYECLTGQSAFSGASVLEIGAQIIHVNPPPPSQINPRIPAELDRITMKTLEKRVEARYQSAEEMLEDLRILQTTLGTDGHPKPWLSTKVTSPSRAVRASALRTLTATFRRPRLSIGFFIIAIGVLGSAVAVTMRLRRPVPHKPSAAAQAWFDKGSEALREGSYHQATKALQQAIDADNNFALAHARLAEAWAELDYTDNAQHEIIRVTALVPERSIYPQLDRLYLDAVIATVARDFDRAVQAYSEIVKLTPEPARVYVDLGRAYEKTENTQQAIQAYIEATNRDPHYAPPLVRLGYLYGRQEDLASANSAFDKAEKLYDSLGNLEGKGEVYFQRGFLFDNLGRPTEAREQLQQTLEISRDSANKPLQIRTLMQLSGVVYDGGDAVKAKEYGREAEDLAQSNGIENLTARGLASLGYAFLNGGDYAEAERYFNQSLEFAQRNNSRRNEARALFSLASLRERQGNSSEVIRLTEQALAFYQGGGFRKEALQCLTLLGRAKRNQGDYAAARGLFEQQLQVSQQVGDQAQLALAHEGLGNILKYQENYPEALRHFDDKYAISKALGKQSSIAFSLISRSEMLWQLGRYAEAHDAIDQAEAIATQTKGGDKNIAAEVYSLKARMALSERKFAEAKANARRALGILGRESDEVAAWAKYSLGFAQALGGEPWIGKRSCEEALTIATRINHVWLRSAATMALAQAMLEAGEPTAALDNAMKSREVFAHTGQRDSEWRAWLIAARAATRLGDNSKAYDYAHHAEGLISELERQWTAEEVKSYMARPDVHFLRIQLSELLTKKPH
jgi:serine/threonine protein kinase/tetratricopeptide (TPR) repeat protein